MNQRLQGWKLALALLVPAVIIGAAGFVAYGALTGDDQDVATGDENVEDVVQEPTATPVPQTAPIDEEPEPEPVPVEAPTALAIPAAQPLPTAVPVATEEPVETATPAAAAPTSAPAPVQPAPTQGPVPTATPDPNVVTIACSGTVPATLEAGQDFGPLNAVLSPPDATSGYQFGWNFGNGETQAGASSGTISYADTGSYTVTLTASNIAAGTSVSAQCGTVTVATPAVALSVSCAVTSANSQVKLADAQPGDEMTVTVSWTPADVVLRLQYDLGVNVPLEIVDTASSNSQTRSFADIDSAFNIFWRNPATGESDRLACAAYPGGDSTSTVTPTVGTGTGDNDSDGFNDDVDNCPAIFNADQLDSDNNGLGNVCDDDDDGDGFPDTEDLCPLIASATNADTDGDGAAGVFGGDACDNCPTDWNAGQLDTDQDGAGDVCDPDDDGDTFPDAADFCPLVATAANVDTDGDGLGDECDDTPNG